MLPVSEDILLRCLFALLLAKVVIGQTGQDQDGSPFWPILTCGNSPAFSTAACSLGQFSGVDSAGVMELSHTAGHEHALCLRSLIQERNKAGRAGAQARGVKIGRKPLLSPQQVAYARTLLEQGERSNAGLAP